MTAPLRGEGQRKRVIILGGGLGGLSAAWELSQPQVRDRYEIVVYQQGWRLGGKGASSRNDAEADRIEEHGLHVWLGFYENAFRMLRTCYEEVPPPAFPRLWDAFVPASHFILEEDRPDGWISWEDAFPEQRDQHPGDGAAVPSIWQQLVRALELSVQYLISASRTPPEVSPKGSLTIKPERSKGGQPGSSNEPPKIKLARQVGAAARALPASMLEHPLPALGGLAGDATLAGALVFAAAMPDDVAQHSAAHHGFLKRCVEQAAEWAHKKVLPIATASDARRRDWYLADLLLACVRGILHDGVLHRGYGVIDDFDFREWLHAHGADRETVDCSLVRTVAYDLQFSYKDGNPATPECSAATALQGLFRLFLTYRGAIAWKMRSGMGEVVFAPLYKALRQRGVTFKFFHQVKALHLGAAQHSGERRLASITMLVQTPPPAGEYQPLVTVHAADGTPIDCWPARPAVELPQGCTPETLESYWCTTGREEKLELKAGDQVILAIPVGAQRGRLCRELRDDQPARWGAMLDQMGAIWTQSVQLWFTAGQEALGWPWGNGTVGGYIETFDTCADMSQLLKMENDAARGIKAVAYLCNAMPTPPWNESAGYRRVAEAATEAVRATAAQFLRDDAGAIWPLAVRRYPSDFMWDRLFDPLDRHGDDRLAAQFVRANSDPSESYVLPLPGTGRFRLHPGDSGYKNLKLAGDWTECGINAGCVEAAVMSGMLAAQAVCGSPSNDQIVGYYGR